MAYQLINGVSIAPNGVIKRIYGHANTMSLLAAILVLYATFSSFAPNFFTFSNQMNILRDAAFVGIIAWGMTLVLICGEIDLSVGPHVAFAGVFLAYLAKLGVPISVAIIMVLLLGGAIGTAAGLLRAYFEAPSFIITLALWLALRGIAQVMSDAVPIMIDDFQFQKLGQGSFLFVPIPVLAMLLLFLLFEYIAVRTVFGRCVYAVGGNAEAARLSGISVKKIRTIIFMLTGLLSALTGIFIASRLGSGNSGAANGLEFDIIAAIVVGGTSLFGGKGTMTGTLLGTIFIAALVNGLVLLGVDPFSQGIVRGSVILFAVLINVIGVKRMII